MNQAIANTPLLYQFELELTPRYPSPLFSPRRAANAKSSTPRTTLNCQWSTAFHNGQKLCLRIPSIAVDIAAEAQVIGCADCGRCYQLTLAFLDNEQAFRFRMIEQLCHIHHYHRQQRHRGRSLSLDEAAREWIGHFSANFASATAII